MSELTAVALVFVINQDYRRSLASLILNKADVARTKQKLELQSWIAKNQVDAAAIASANDVQKKLQALLRNDLKDTVENNYRNSSKDKNQLDLVTTLNQSLGNYPQLDSIVFVANNKILFYLENKPGLSEFNGNTSNNSFNSINIDVGDRPNNNENNGKGYLNFQDDQPIVTFANPVFDESGNKIGKLLVNSKLERFSKSVEKSKASNVEIDHNLFDNYLIGKLPNNSFFVIKSYLEIKNNAAFVESVVIKQAFTNVENTSRYRSQTGINVLGSYGKFDDFEMIIFSEINEKMALASADRNIWHMLIIANGVVLVMTAICYLLTRYQMRIILEIVDVAAAIVRGDDAKFPVWGRDEMGALAIALNHLLTRFKKIEQNYGESKHDQNISLDRSNLILNKYIDITSEGFMLLDCNGSISDINANFAEILFISVNEAIGGNYTNMLPTEILPLIGEMLRRSPQQTDHKKTQQIEFYPPYDQGYIITVSAIFNQETKESLQDNDHQLIAVIVTAQAIMEPTSPNLQNNYINSNRLLLNSDKYREEVAQKLRIPMTSLLGFLKVTQQKLESSILPKITSTDDKTKRSIQQVSQNLEVMISEGMLIGKAIADVLQNDQQNVDSKSVLGSKAITITQLFQRFHAEAMGICHQKNCQLIFESAIDAVEIQSLGHNIADDLLYIFHNLLYRLALTAKYGNIIFNARLINHRLVIATGKMNLALSSVQVNSLMDKLYTAIAVNKTPRKNEQISQDSGLTKIQNILDKYGGTTALETLESNRESYQFYVLTLPINSCIDTAN